METPYNHDSFRKEMEQVIAQSKFAQDLVMGEVDENWSDIHGPSDSNYLVKVDVNLESERLGMLDKDGFEIELQRDFMLKQNGMSYSAIFECDDIEVPSNNMICAGLGFWIDSVISRYIEYHNYRTMYRVNQGD